MNDFHRAVVELVARAARVRSDAARNVPDDLKEGWRKLESAIGRVVTDAPDELREALMEASVVPRSQAERNRRNRPSGDGGQS